MIIASETKVVITGRRIKIPARFIGWPEPSQRLLERYRGARDEAQLPVSNHGLSGLEAALDYGVVVDFSARHHRSHLHLHIFADNKNKGALLTGLERRGGNYDRIGNLVKREADVDESPWPQSPVFILEQPLEQDCASRCINR